VKDDEWHPAYARKNAYAGLPASACIMLQIVFVILRGALYKFCNITNFFGRGSPSQTTANTPNPLLPPRFTSFISHSVHLSLPFHSPRLITFITHTPPTPLQIPQNKRGTPYEYLPYYALIAHVNFRSSFLHSIFFLYCSFHSSNLCFSLHPTHHFCLLLFFTIFFPHPAHTPVLISFPPNTSQ